jgi:putative CocE/NonD family hydrolase
MKSLFSLLFQSVLFASVINSFPCFAQDRELLVRDSVRIPLRNGKYVSAIIVTDPAIREPLPAVLFYTTYYMGPGDINVARRAALKGYVGVLVYCRGIRSDLADYIPFVNDGNDAYDVIDWISRQKWCNGKIGMYGGSYTGYVQWAAASRFHPALKTIVPQVPVMPGFDFPMENNIPLGHILSWSHDNIYKLPRLNGDLLFTWFEKGMPYRRLDSLAGRKNPIFQQWLRHPAYDQYWQSLAPSPSQYGQINIPVLTTTGYYDGCAISALEYYKRHNQFNSHAEHYLVIGPYDHWGGQRRFADTLMGYAVDSAARLNMVEIAFDWLDHILKGAPRPSILKDRINYEIMGANQWGHAPTLEAMSNDTLTYYLGSSQEGRFNSLEQSKPLPALTFDQQVDFRDRVNHNNYFTPLIINETLEPGGGLVFASPAFREPVLLNGAFSGRLKVMVNKKDMDISIAFYEQMPDGRYFYLTRYLGRASYAGQNSRRQLLVPGKEVIIPISNTRITSRKFSKGSRLVIVLNVNKHPFEVVNYGSGKDVNDESVLDAGVPMQIHWSSESFIKVPVQTGIVPGGN